MAGSRYGSLFSLITFGESHGPYIGVVIDGIKPGLSIDIAEIQREMQRRRPGQSSVSTPRDEKDRAEIVSGVFEGKTTGTPICVLIRNEDQRSKDYSKLAEIFRPGHAAFTYLKKYGIFDYRGGGRASGRETATRVAAGAIAKQILREYGVSFHGFVRKIGPYEAQQVDYSVIEQNPVRCPDSAIAPKMEAYIREVAEQGDSVGGIVELHISGLPPGLGDPVFEKLDAELAHGLMSIGATKGIEFGSGFKAAEMLGSENNDVFHVNEKGEVMPRTNNAGGLLGGISTGQDVVLRLAVKPPSSINKVQQTVDKFGKPVALSVGGRHDPCICPRVVPVAEAMAAIVILDLLLIQQQIQQNQQFTIHQELDLVDAQLALLIQKRLSLAGQTTENEPKNLERFAETLALPPDLLRQFWELLKAGK
jgi:chorismate synthase